MTPLTDRTFDRRPEHDERNQGYGIRRLAAARAATLPERSWSWRYVQLDQGAEGACVGFGCTMEAAATPKPVFGDPWYHRDTFTPDLLEAIDGRARSHYREAQLIDPPEWNTPPEEGTSEEAGLKIGQKRGYWKSYLWADPTDPERAADEVFWAVGHRGPVILATWWRTDMEGDGDDYLDYSGARLGGHLYLATRVSIRTKRDAIWTPNSWGGEGQGWIKRASLVAALADGGTAALVQDRLMPPP